MRFGRYKILEEIFRDKSKKLGFGCMRLPMKDGKVDYEETCKMADSFMAAGFTYFDTAKGYIGKTSEAAVRECVVKRFPRDSFTLADKLTDSYFDSEEGIRGCFEEQLKTCGVDYFDYYLMHSQTKANYGKFQKYRAYEIASELKKEGKIRHLGFSFHDTADFLEQILTDHPEAEFVQIQLNYADYEDSGIQSRKCLEVCKKFGKPVVVMEPVKGGRLVNLPSEADEILRFLGTESNAGYAIRFAASLEPVAMVLSGMSDLSQMEDNIGNMKDFVPFNGEEFEAVSEVAEILKKQSLIPCTGCRYCVEGCPQKILIPDLFADLNGEIQYGDGTGEFYYSDVHTRENGKASSCLKCGKCEKICPQHLEIRGLLEKVAAKFEK